MSNRDKLQCAVSLAAIFEFAKNLQNDIAELSTQKVVETVIIPATQKDQCAYVDLLPDKSVSTPSYYISHVWSAPFSSLVTALKNFTDVVRHNTIYVWLDIFSVNQHAVKFDQIPTVIENAPYGTILCMDKENNVWSRLWCLYEIWQTFKLNKPVWPTGRVDLPALFSWKFEHAQTTKPEDKEFILNRIQENFNQTEIIQKLIKGFHDEGVVRSSSKKSTQVCCDAILNYGDITLTIGDYKNALGLFENAFPIQMELFGFEHEENLNTLNKIADLCNLIGIKESLWHTLRMAEILSEKLYGKKHLKTANIYKNYGIYYNETGMHSVSIDYCEQALQVYKTNYGLEHPSTIKCLNLIAKNSFELGKYKEAFTVFEQTLELTKKVYGHEHTNTAEILIEMGQTLIKQQKVDKGAKFMELGIDTNEKLKHPSMKDVAICRHNLGNIYYGIEDYGSALGQFQKAMDILEKEVGMNSKEIVPVLVSLGFLCGQLGQNEVAIPLLGKALDIQIKENGPDHPEIVGTLVMFGTVLISAGEKEEGFTLMEKALQIQEETKDPQVEETKKLIERLKSNK